MKTYYRGFATCVFGLSMVLGATADSSTKPPSFLKIGSRYTFYFAGQADAFAPHGEIVEFGPGPWMRVQFVVPENSGALRPLTASKDKPVPGTKTDNESWFNFTRLTAVVPAEKPSGEVSTSQPADAPALPKVGVSCFFGTGHPYLGKVMEIGEDGWFRVRELTLRLVKDQQSHSQEKDWWINSASLSQLTEARPEHLPK